MCTQSTKKEFRLGALFIYLFLNETQILQLFKWVLFSAELTPWTPWTPCSKTCGSGERSRQRECQLPSFEKKSSSEDPKNECGNAPLFEREICNPQKCPVFTEWSDWSQCTKTCGGGKQSRKRACVLPPLPAFYAKQKLVCDGRSMETRFVMT